MKLFLYITCMVSIQLIMSCNDTANQPDKVAKVDTPKTDALIPVSAPPKQMQLKATAHLIYKDGSLSKFDILNDKSVALWNVVAAGGDAEQASEKVQLMLSGTMDSVSVLVKNGKKTVVDEKNVTVAGDKIYKLNNTGCSDVIVAIQRNAVVKYRDTISFRCGE